MTCTQGSIDKAPPDAIDGIRVSEIASYPPPRRSMYSTGPAFANVTTGVVIISDSLIGANVTRRGEGLRERDRALGERRSSRVSRRRGGARPRAQRLRLLQRRERVPRRPPQGG